MDGYGQVPFSFIFPMMITTFIVARASAPRFSLSL
jgi:hypothetical protein